MMAAGVLAVAMVLDAWLGEPDWLWRRLPHPAVQMGRLVGWLDRLLNRGEMQMVKGVLTLAVLVIAGAVIGWVLQVFGAVVECVIVAVLLAQKSLVQHVRAVADGLRLSLAEGRRAVARIVSRDTGEMGESAAARSAIESAAENLSDGVIAPAFWFLIGGLPGILIYKLINTADSMIGYRTPRYAAFGWAAARADDVLNWVPARLTALLIALSGQVLSDWAAVTGDARKHRSPNAGWPEAAMARAIDVALAGPRSYDGTMRAFAWVNPEGRREIGAGDVDAAIGVLWRTWGLMLGAVMVVLVVTI